MKRKQIILLTEAAMIAALYVLLTFLSALFGLSSGVIQFRLSEALAVLPVFTPAAVPGLAVGCLLANILTGCAPWDVVCGTAATLLGAFVARLLRKRRLLASLPNLVANTVTVPFVLRAVYSAPDSLPFLFLTVGIGEVVCGGILGTLLLLTLVRYGRRLFPE